MIITTALKSKKHLMVMIKKKRKKRKKIGLTTWPLKKNFSMLLCNSDEGTCKEVLLITYYRNKELNLRDLDKGVAIDGY